MAGAVGSVAGAANRGLAVVASVTTEAALVDLALRGAVERQTHVLEVDDCVDRFFCENLCGILINEVVATLNPVSYTHLDVYKRQVGYIGTSKSSQYASRPDSGS